MSVLAKGKKTVQWTVLREAREKRVPGGPPRKPVLNLVFDTGFCLAIDGDENHRSGCPDGLLRIA